MIFCHDFKIREHVSRDKLIEIYKKFATFQKYLNSQQFQQVVMEIANEMYGTKSLKEIDADVDDYI